MKRTASDAAQTREALLQAALESFGEFGWKASTFENVAERAGVTRGALHHHFRSKQSLLVEALNWGWSEYGSHLFDSKGDRESGQAFLVSLFNTFIILLRSDEQFRALVSTTVLTAPQAFETADAKYNALDLWRNDIFDVLVGDGLSSTDAHRIAGLVIVVLQGLTLSAVTRPEDLPKPEDTKEVSLTLAKGLLG